jgi:hypothetical protein
MKKALQYVFQAQEKQKQKKAYFEKEMRPSISLLRQDVNLVFKTLKELKDERVNNFFDNMSPD